MKKLLVLFMMPALAFGQSKESWTQLQAHHTTNKSFVFVFLQRTETYADLSNVDYTYPSSWDDPYISLPVPFPITHLGVSVDSLYMDYGSELYGLSNSSSDEVIFAAMSVDLIDRGYANMTAQSPISHVTEGATPLRTFKFEWKNAGFYEEQWWGTNNYFANVQLWIHEDGNFEYHFGPSNVSQALNDTLYQYESLISGTARFNASTFNIFDMHLLRGSSASPTMVDSIDQVTEWPANGTVYEFRMPGVSQVEQDQIVVDLYPNPVSAELRIMAKPGENFNVSIMDMSGQVVKRGVMNSNTSIDLSTVPAGVYLAKIMNPKSGEQQTIRLVVNR